MATCSGHNRRAPHRGKKGLDSPRGKKGEEAKGRPSHLGRAILGRSTCFTNDLLQNVDGHTWHRHIRRNAIHVGFPTPVPRSYTLRTCARNNVSDFGVLLKDSFFEFFLPKLPKAVQNVDRSLDFQVIQIDEQELYSWSPTKGC